MITIRWVSIVLFIVCILVIADGVREWLLVGLAVVFFLAATWTYRNDPVEDDSPDALGSLDLLERSQSTAGGLTPTRSPRANPPGGPPSHL
jgi:hypothetical protein